VVRSNGSLDGRRQPFLASNRHGPLATAHHRVLDGQMSLATAMGP